MLKKYFHHGCLKILIIFLSFPFSYAQQTNDIIPLINLKAGKTDSILISDLYFAENYNATFFSTKKINVIYKPVARMLFLTPAKDFEGMDLVRFKHGNIFYHIPVKSELIQTYTFEYTPQKPVNKVTLFGSFNSWNRENLVLSDQGNGTFSIDISLEAGTYEYKFFVDGEEIVDPNNLLTKPNGFGGFNSLLTIENKNLGKNYLHILNAEKNEENISINFFLENENSNVTLTRDNLIALLDNQRIIDQNIKINGNNIEIIVTPDQQKRFKIVRLAITQNGASSNFQTFFLKNFEGLENQTQDKIIYALMIDRFKDGDKSNSNPVQHPELLPPANYQGGDLQGILDKINDGYFTKLGINTLWVSPVVNNTNEAYQEYPPPHRFYTGYHGYWPVSSTEVEEKFGDMALLKTLIKTAHENGIKILLDFVSNHIHIEHPLWENNREWFGVLELPNGTKNLRLWDEQRLTTWFEPYMPSFDYLGSEEALEAMTDNAVWWLKETGADGFRHDAVKHVPNEFWRMLTKKIKKEIKEKEIYQIGETFGSFDLVSSYVNNGQLDAQFNFNLYDTALPVFLNENSSFADLDSDMHRTFKYYGVNHLMGNVMDSHDKVRYMAYADGDIELGSPDAGEIAWTNPPQVDNESSHNKLVLHLAYIFSIPGIPILYYGDEIGMTGASDPDNRRMMRFDDELNVWETETLDAVIKIVNLRKDHSALRYGDFQTLAADENNYIYLRSDGKEKILTALNKSESVQNIKINLPDFYNIKSAIDLITGEKEIQFKNNFEFEIPSIGFRIFKLE